MTPPRILLALLPALAAGCAATAPSALVQVPENLRPDPADTLAFVLPAVGVQIYECRARNDGSGYEWAFVAPEAELFDPAHRRVGRHYAGPHWEAADGSKVRGSTRERADAPGPDAIPWLLLSATPSGPEGLFSKVTSIQRVQTVGGVAPASGCSESTVGTQSRVRYTADYYLFVRDRG
jgi:hypothetical protein